MQGNMLDVESMNLQVNYIDLKVTSTCNYTSSSYIVETTLVDIYLLGFFHVNDGLPIGSCKPTNDVVHYLQIIASC
jgi:hypothetical protein